MTLFIISWFLAGFISMLFLWISDMRDEEFDEYYFDKRLTLLNKSLSSKDHEINRLKSHVRRLRTENKKLENAKNDIRSSESLKITGKFRNLLNKF